MHFGYPENLYWLLILVPMAGAAIWYWFWQRSVRREIGEREMVDQMAASHSSGLRVVRIGLIFVAVALLVVASARPQWGRIQQTVQQEGIDLVFALDLSKSMLARDVPPTRLESATGEIEETLDRLNGDRVGMVVFTTVSFAQSPLTTDYGALRFYLDKLDPNQMSIGGTSIGKALTDSVELLTGQSIGGGEESQAARNARMDRADNQVVVVITDGEDHESNPVELAKTARERGIHVVTVGVGTADGAKIPILGRNGRIRGYKRSKSGEVVRTTLKEEQLKEIARAGGGIYIPYNGENSVTDRLGDFISRLETSNLESKKLQRYRDRFMWFLTPGVLLLLASFLLGERRRGRLGWGSDGSTGVSIILLTALALPLGGCSDLFRDEEPTVAKANGHVESGEWDEAINAYEQAEESLDEPPAELHYNRGVAELGRQKFEEARQQLARGLESGDPAVRFDAHYNMGVASARQQNWEDAVESFESALRIHANHPAAIDEKAVEKARYNTEVTYRKLYPPCRTQEEKLEENDTPQTAKRLKKGKKKKQKDPDLTLCGLDDDWYEVPAVPGSTVTVTATFRQLGERPDPERTFLPAPEDLKLELYDANGEQMLAGDEGAEQADEPTESGPVTRKIDEFVVPDGVARGKNAALRVRLAAADQLQFDYDLDIEVTPPCRALEEKAEENDTPEQASVVDKGKHPGQICGDDPDWYEVSAQMGDSVFFDLRPVRRKKGGGGQLSPEQLQLKVVDADSGESIGQLRREGPFWTTGLQQIDDDRTFQVEVSAKNDDVEGAYRLDVYRYEPCIIGDDRHEENDSLKAATQFKGKSKHHRYLRLCGEDPDFFRFQPTKPQKSKRPMKPGAPTAGQKQGKKKKPRLSVGLSLRPRPNDDPEVSMQALDPKTGKVISLAKSTADQKGPPEAERAFDQVLQMKDVQQKQVPVKVEGDSTFYHLVELSSQNQQKNQKKRQQNEQNQKNKKNEQKNEQKNEKGDQKQSKNDKKRDSDKKKSKSGDQKKKDQQKKQQKKKQKSAKQKRTEDILKALEDSDENFQLRKALEDAEKNQRHGVDKDW